MNKGRETREPLTSTSKVKISDVSKNKGVTRERGRTGVGGQ